jgi:hypothetical protein
MYSNISQSKALQNIPKLGIFDMKIYNLATLQSGRPVSFSHTNELLILLLEQSFPDVDVRRDPAIKLGLHGGQVRGVGRHLRKEHLQGPGTLVDTKWECTIFEC